MKTLYVIVVALGFVSAPHAMAQADSCPQVLEEFCKEWTVDRSSIPFADEHLTVGDRFRIDALAPDPNGRIHITIQALGRPAGAEYWGPKAKVLSWIRRDEDTVCLAGIITTHPDVGAHLMTGQLGDESEHRWHQISLFKVDDGLEIAFYDRVNDDPPTGCGRAPYPGPFFPTHGGRAHAH